MASSLRVWISIEWEISYERSEVREIGEGTAGLETLWCCFELESA
jgi:hypothetical protein